jgi:cellulose synthase/poly-beta-1,6-N-acetylglucosamine synthase-like glycosyltransferase
VQGFIQADERISLLRQHQREGKASAINLFLSRATGDLIILESGDTVPALRTFDLLLEPFRDQRVGMTGAHPVPDNPEDTFVGFVVQLMWSLHHRIALLTPKLGELVAFRNVIRAIPHDTAVDEAMIEALIQQAGYRISYVPEAVVHNSGPRTVSDFLRQRRRISAGHICLSHKQHYRVSTSHPLRILRLLQEEHHRSLRHPFWTAGAIVLEMIGRALGSYDYYVKRKNPYIWDIALTTKRGL